MHTLSVGTGRVHTLAYSPNGGLLVVDMRSEPTRHPWTNSEYRPARELVWWDRVTGTASRRFRLRDSLFAIDSGDPSPKAPALGLSFGLAPLRVATVWEWTNKEDGVCVYDPDAQRQLMLTTPYKTHTHLVALDCTSKTDSVAVATSNDMDGSRRLEVWEMDASEESDDSSEHGTWREIRAREELQGHWHLLRSLHTLAFEGRFVAGASSNPPRVIVWDSHLKRSATEAERDVGFDPQWLAFSSIGSILAIGGAGLLIHDPHADDWRPIERSGSTITAITFSANGRHLLIGTEVGTVEVWEADGRQRTGYDWRLGSITAVAFAPDGLTCAAGTATGNVVAWDA